jgi:hypothetical protein
LYDRLAYKLRYPFYPFDDRHLETRWNDADCFVISTSGTLTNGN